MHTGETSTLTKSAWNFTKCMHSMPECTEHQRLLDVDWTIFDKNFKTAIWKQCRASMRSGGSALTAVSTQNTAILLENWQAKSLFKDVWHI